MAAGTGVGLALDLATLPFGVPGLFTIAGLAVGAFGGGAYNIAYDPSANRVDATFSESIIPGEFERHLQLVQTLATSGVAAATEGLHDTPAAVKLGAFRLNDTADARRRLEADLSAKLPLVGAVRETIRAMLAKPRA